MPTRTSHGQDIAHSTRLSGARMFLQLSLLIGSIFKEPHHVDVRHRHVNVVATLNPTRDCLLGPPRPRLAIAHCTEHLQWLMFRARDVAKRVAKSDADSKKGFCSAHRKPGYVDLFHKKCMHPEGCLRIAAYTIPGCLNRPVFSWSRNETATHCKLHRQRVWNRVKVCDEMPRRPEQIQKRSRVCYADGCCKQPTFGNTSDPVPVACKFHRLPHHIDVVNKRCQFQGPEVVSAGQVLAKRAHGSQHVDLRHAKCRSPEVCSRLATYGFLQDGIARFCAHESNMVCLPKYKCDIVACTNKPNFKKPLFSGNDRFLLCKSHYADFLQGRVDESHTRYQSVSSSASQEPLT
ncbi:hypothetical protein GUITHDRAFT_100573 [Guillardia theta CCMP2712]|uniref:Uncharacterized protein n=1 Tax=Guillardia theta (strain CCMP2712) TaxID=905079 RepID=L1JZ33_GUITC|nr:hypothetical protein GUITHDRAFT_100573 [Guillardia theta CCMP2712]EKX53589.1 hypothetical protein GUITHDRAFT_100573 [Guillardia theta CCMP2712]|eukprot:XP_005840569.1 hypothetical protein GUITHDRAFT_100573 [Guillardia theta CCMP2712]